jgi:hypothetical protein
VKLIDDLSRQINNVLCSNLLTNSAISSGQRPRQPNIAQHEQIPGASSIRYDLRNDVSQRMHFGSLFLLIIFIIG